MQYQLPQRDRVFLEFVRHLACSVKGCRRGGVDQVDPHHAKYDWRPVSEGGMSQKGSDYCAIPLCRIHHGEIEAKGDSWFEERYGIEIERVIVATLITFIVAIRSRN